jgi:hypothetical protein
MTAPATSIVQCQAKANLIASEELPYSYAGGHDLAHLFEPSIGTNGKRGFDCSGAVSAALHAGGILEHPSGPLGTYELARWGAAGEGEFMTLWVINNALIHHCLLKFKDANGHSTFWAARHEDTIVGYFTGIDRVYLVSMGYSPRRRKA